MTKMRFSRGVVLLLATTGITTTGRAQDELGRLASAYRSARFAEFDAIARGMEPRLLSPKEYAAFHQLLGFAALARRDTVGARQNFREAIRPGGGIEADTTLHSPSRRAFYAAERGGAPVVGQLSLRDSTWRSLDEPLRVLVDINSGASGATISGRWCESTSWRGPSGYECHRAMPEATRYGSGELAILTSEPTTAPASGAYELALVSRSTGYEVGQVWRAVIATDAPQGLRLPEAPVLGLVGETKTVGGWKAHPIAGPLSLLSTIGAVWGFNELGRNEECYPPSACGRVRGGLMLYAVTVGLVWPMRMFGGSKRVTDDAAVRENQRRRRLHSAAMTQHAATVAEMRRSTVTRVTRLERIQ